MIQEETAATLTLLQLYPISTTQKAGLALDGDDTWMEFIAVKVYGNQATSVQIPRPT